MPPSDSSPKSGTGISLLLGAVGLGNVVVGIFGCVMFTWAVQEMSYKGEQWGLLGVMFLGGIALLVTLALLLPGTILAMVRMKGRSGPRVFLIVSFLFAAGSNVAALACIPLSTVMRDARLRSEHIVYTSGLYDAVKRGDVAKAEGIINSNPATMSDYTLERSLLAMAVDNDDASMVQMLLEHGASVKDGGGGLPSPLHLAASRGNQQVAKLLLKAGADVNAEDSDTSKRTPLTYAQNTHQTAMVQFLKDRGAGTVNLKDAAWRAAYFGHVEELRAILDQGFDVNESGTLLDTAAEEGHIDVVQLLVGRGARLDTTQGLGTALHAAAYHGQTEIIRYLISKGADPNALESRNYTPLYWAAENGHFEAVRALLDNGADPSLGVSPLAEARRQGHQAVVNLLKERGAKD